MEPKFSTSFIPKKPIISGEESRMTVTRSTNIFSLLATVIFIVVVLVSGGLFLYKNILKGQIVEADKNIALARAALQPEKIQEIIDANSRIVASKGLLERHIVVSKLLLLLQNLTVKKVRFTEFTYTNKNTEPILYMKGEVQTYNALAEQDRLFSANEFIKKPEFYDFSLVSNGLIEVNFSATIDPNLVSYKKAIESLEIEPQAPPQATSTENELLNQ